MVVLTVSGRNVRSLQTLHKLIWTADTRSTLGTLWTPPLPSAIAAFPIRRRLLLLKATVYSRPPSAVAVSESIAEHLVRAAQS
eukprot:1177756-Prorocentrum_minimum.AAC.3